MTITVHIFSTSTEGTSFSKQFFYSSNSFQQKQNFSTTYYTACVNSLN